MISRSTPRRLGFAVIGALIGALAAFGFSAAAGAAPVAPTPKPSNATISISGPTVKRVLTFRKDKQPTQYAQLLAEVSWMNGRTGDVITSTPASLGPHFTVTVLNGSKATGRFDLYPEVVGGPRAHRLALGSVKDAWFFAPVDMASSLAALGVAMPTTAPSQQAFVKPTVAPTSLQHSLSSIARESVTALVLAALGCVAILILLAFAARRSHSVDRRRTLPPAMGRLAFAKAKASSGTGSVLRGAAPGQRADGGTVYATPPGGGRATPVGASTPGRSRTPAVRTPPPPGARVPAGTPMRPKQRAEARQLPPGAGLTPATSAAAAKRAAAARQAADSQATEKRGGWRGLLANRGAVPKPRKSDAPTPAIATPGSASASASVAAAASMPTVTAPPPAAAPPAAAPPAAAPPAAAPPAAAPPAAVPTPDVSAPAGPTEAAAPTPSPED